MKRRTLSIMTLGLSISLLTACGDKDTPGGDTTFGEGGTSSTGDGDGDGDTTGDGDGDGDTTGDGDGDETGDEDGVPFVVPPDGGDGDGDLCDIWAESDCAEGEKCTAWDNSGMGSWNENKCVEVMGDGIAGDDCMAPNGGTSGEDDCAKGGICWDIDGDTGLGYCVDFCTGQADDAFCSGDSICAIYNNGVLPLCLPTCDPLIGGGDCPNTNNVCVNDPGGQGFVCVLNASGDMGPDGTECQYVNSCNQGLFCANADAVADCQGSEGCCSPFCDLTDGDPDAACTGQGEECVSWYEEGMAPPGYEHVGGCLIPE